MAQLTSVDYLVICSYLAGIMAIGLWIGSYVRSGKDFFLAGRHLPWWAIGISVVTTDIGGSGLVGMGGDAYRYGIAMGNFEWIGSIPGMIVGAFVFIPHLWRCRVTTIPEFLELRFNVQLRSSVAACWLFFMACNLGVMLLASARFMNSFAGWDVSVCILTTALLVGVYTWSGGLGAVVYTDVLQGFLVTGGCLMFVVIGIYQMGGVERVIDDVHAVARQQDRNEVRQREHRLTSLELARFRARHRIGRPDHESEHLSLVQAVETRSPVPWPAVLFGLCFIVGPGYWIGNQYVVQRTLGAKSEYDAKASYIFGALLKNLIPFLVAVPGLIALVQFPEIGHGRADEAFGRLVSALLPTGFRGAFVAAFLGSLMSSVDSYLNAATALYVNDFYRRFYRRNADEGQMLAVGRWTTAGFVGWGVFLAFQLSAFPEAGIFTMFQTLASFFVGPTLAVLVSGMLSRNTSSDGALVGFFSGVLTALGLFAMNQPSVNKYLGIDPLFEVNQPYVYYSIWSFTIAMSFILILSYFLRSDPIEKTRYAIGGINADGGAV